MDSIIMNKRKHIVVVAAIIVRDGRIFATQRGYGEWKDWWEFPGGKKRRKKVFAGKVGLSSILLNFRFTLDIPIIRSANFV